MDERIPSLDIVWPVTNISEQNLARVQECHFERTNSSLHRQEMVRGVFNPVDALRSTAVARTEFIGIQRYLGSRSLSAPGVAELANHLREVLPGSDEPLETLTYPVQLRQVGQSEKLSVITIAGSPEVIRRRAIAKRAIAKFVGVGLPDDLWLPNSDPVTKVWLAWQKIPRSSSHKVMRSLYVTLRKSREKELLPSVTKFGEMQVRESG